MEQGIWQEIEALHQKFVKLGISEAVDYEKYYLYSLIAHSTAIECSTLTEVETQLPFGKGVVTDGKPLVYYLMNEDLKNAYELAKAKCSFDAHHWEPEMVCHQIDITSKSSGTTTLPLKLRCASSA